MENEEKITEICIAMNDIEMLIDEILIKYDVLNVYLMHKAVNYPVAHSALFVLENINPDYEKLVKLYSETQKSVFDILKTFDN